MTRRKRVLFLINSLAGGGAERVMCTLLRHSETEREEFDITLGLIDNEPAANTPPDWVKVRQLDGRGSLTRSVMEVRGLFAEVKPDISVSFLTRANFSNVINARGPSIISERAHTATHFGTSTKGQISKALVRALYPRATKVIAVSGGVAEGLRDDFGVPADRLISIPNPVDVQTIQERAKAPSAFMPDAPYILAAGRMVASKNFEMLIRAYAQSGIDEKLVIAGDGELVAQHKALVQELGLGDRVFLPGFIANPYPLMSKAELFVLSSNSEGFPNALVESMALGLPVIATNAASGPSEILADAARESITELTYAPHGVLTPMGSVEDMAEALRTMRDPELRKVYGEKAAIRARSFSATAAKDRYWDVIRDTLNAGRGRR